MPKIADIEATPNPNAYRFVLKERLTSGLPRAFASSETAATDPLAKELFAIEGVVNVYYVDKWITITQDGSQSWPYLLKKLAEPIRGAAGISDDAIESLYSPWEDEEALDESDPRVSQIKQILDEKVRPALMADGGDLRVIRFNDNILTVRYFGACGSCPSSLSGTLNAIQNLVHSVDPEIEVVVE